MKGIMFLNFLKPFLGVYLFVCLVSATKEKNVNSTTTTTTTTAKPFDLSGVETRHFESSIPILHPGESLSRSHSESYSRSSQHYEQQNPGYSAGINEDEGQSKEQFYKDNDRKNYHNLGKEQQSYLPQVVHYFKSHEAQQQHYGDHKENYKGPQEQTNNYPHPDHDVKDQTSYGHQESYGFVKDENHGDNRPLFNYAYEISSDPQHQQHYELPDVPNSAEKPTYGSIESEDYAPKLQQAEYYPKPKPTRYIPEDAHKQDYGSEEKDNYFPNIPKEAGYVTNVQKEHGYLQIPKKESSYPKEAGYSPRNNEPSAFLPIIPKEKSVGSTNDGKVAVYIKHLGHKAPGSNQYVNKERQGFLLLPIVHKKELKQVHVKSGEEHKHSYQENKQANYGQSSVNKKHDHVQPKVSHYPVNAKLSFIHHVPAYKINEEEVKRPIKSTFSQSNYHIARPAVKHTTGRNTEYKNAEAYTDDDKSDERPAPYIPHTVVEYGKQSKEKAYSTGPLTYSGHHQVIPSLTTTFKSEPASSYSKKPEFSQHYDLATLHKQTEIKEKDFHPSSFSSMYHAQGYPRIVDLSLTANKDKKSAPIASHSYSPSAGESPRYKNQPSKISLDHEKSLFELIHKPDETDIAGFKPTSYTSRGRISAKGLVDGFGLHDYESLLSKPSYGGSLDSLYYDLHSFPAEHIYTRFRYPRSNIPAKLIL